MKETNKAAEDNKEVEENVENTETTETTEIAVKEETAIATRGGAYITKLLYKIKEEFVAINEGIELDFVYMGDRLKIDAKGNFVEADDETAKFGDNIDVVVGAGQKLFSLWGAKESPEEGKLIVAEDTMEKATEVLDAYLESNPEAADRYGADDIKLRFVTYFVPVEAIASGEEFPQIYLMTFPMTTTIGFGKYAMKLFKGKYKANGIPSNTAVNRVVTRLTTVEKKGSGNDSYIGIEFEGVGMFNPEEYGIKEDQA